MRARYLTALFFFILGTMFSTESSASDDAAKLQEEIHHKGWIVYCSRADNGTWDLFLCRPDGSDKRNLTNTADFEEAAPRFSPDGKKILYRRLDKGSTINHDKWGFQGKLTICNSDGSDPVEYGGEGEYPWAAWSPDGTQIASLTVKGIQVIDLATRKVVKEFPRKGIYQQLFWSPDGKWFCGTGNHGGESWTVVRMNLETGEVNALRSFQTCTPDWYPDSEHVILSSRPAGQPANNGYGYTQLWEVDGEGKEQKLLYGEDGVHIYSGAVSPDGEYILFSKCPDDGGGAERSGGTICLMRSADAPTIGGPSPELRKVHPDVKNGPVIEIDKGWEPHWTYQEISVRP
ncbi:MAG: PD40 domain-containing protein [Candidatus Omnitrophica bacterium]|nr:PD40 domain-containing protein [Candidatus Omnitrophota bacterium]